MNTRYHLGRAQHALKGVEKGDTVVKIRNKAGKVIDTIKPGDKPGKMSEWLSQATGSGWAGETGRHLGKHQEKYVTGGLVAGGTGAVAALAEREARKNREKGKQKKGSFEGAVEKMAAAGKVRTLEGWDKQAGLKLPSAVMDAAKKARKVGKPAPLKQPKMNIISGFSTGRR